MGFLVMADSEKTTRQSETSVLTLDVIMKQVPHNPEMLHKIEQYVRQKPGHTLTIQELEEINIQTAEVITHEIITDNLNQYFQQVAQDEELKKSLHDLKQIQHEKLEQSKQAASQQASMYAGMLMQYQLQQQILMDAMFGIMIQQTFQSLMKDYDKNGLFGSGLKAKTEEGRQLIERTLRELVQADMAYFRKPESERIAMAMNRSDAEIQVFLDNNDDERLLYQNDVEAVRQDIPQNIELADQVNQIDSYGLFEKLSVGVDHRKSANAIRTDYDHGYRPGMQHSAEHFAVAPEAFAPPPIPVFASPSAPSASKIEAVIAVAVTQEHDIVQDVLEKSGPPYTSMFQSGMATLSAPRMEEKQSFDPPGGMPISNVSMVESAPGGPMVPSLEDTDKQLEAFAAQMLEDCLAANGVTDLDPQDEAKLLKDIIKDVKEQHATTGEDQNFSSTQEIEGEDRSLVFDATAFKAFCAQDVKSAATPRSP